MNEQLAQEIAALEEQERIFTAELERINSTTPVDVSAYNAVQAEITNVHEKLQAKRNQVAQVETAVADIQNDTAEGLAQIDLGDGQTASIYDYVVSPEAGEFIVGYILQKVGEVTAKATVQAQSYQQELDAKDDQLAAKDRELAFLQEQNDKLGLDNADLQAKRDAAAAQIEEQEEENKRLQKELSDLRENVVKPATNTTANLRELAEKAKAARPKIYNVHWKDESNRKTYVANDAETGEEIEFGYLFLGKYNVISEEEALQFRQSLAQAAVEEASTVSEPVQAAPVPDMPLVTPQEEVPSEPTVSEHPVYGEVASETSGYAERIASLEARVAALELNGVAV